SHQNVISFGVAAEADVRLTDISATGLVAATLTYRGESARMQMVVPGEPNAINAAGAVAVLVVLGHDLTAAVRAVEAFAGTVRRFELHGTERGVSVFDDYAHHPTEVKAALETARSVVGEGRIIAIQQPHTYSRTQQMFREFAE